MTPPAGSEDTMCSAAASGPRPAQSLIGQTLAGRYFLSDLIGVGGMGEVYSALHIGIGRRVAVKVLREDVQEQEPSTVERLRREARAAAATGHPNVIEVFDFLTLRHGGVAIVMEFLDGETLQDLVAAGPMPAARVVHIGLQVTRAMSAAHAAGVIHRDLKPENVVLLQREAEPDFVKVLDFGIATDPHAARPAAPFQPTLTRPGFTMGTPAFMAPEQFADAQVGPAADIYAVGAILYMALTGQTPHAGASPLDLLTAKLGGPPCPAGQLVPDVPPALDQLVLRMLASDPAARPASMLEVKRVLAALDRVLGWPESIATLAVAPARQVAQPPPPRPPETCGECTRELAAVVLGAGAWRRRGLAAAVLLALGLLGGLVATSRDTAVIRPPVSASAAAPR